MLNIALPNGTMEEEAVRLFHNVGVDFIRNFRQYQATTSDHRVSYAVFMRPEVIPYVVARGLYDLGITGSDCVAEAEDCQVTTLAKLRYGKTKEHDWRLVLFSGNKNPASSLKDIENNAVIFSEYPRITQRALEKAKKRASIYFSPGTTEANVPRDFPYGVGITSRGLTLKVNHLKIIEVLSQETAVIIGGPRRMENQERELACISLVGELIRCA